MTPINKRNITYSIIFTILTFGIYGIFWNWLLLKNIRTITNDKRKCTGEMLLLTFIPFYSVYWWYKNGKTVKTEFQNADVAVFEKTWVYIILAFVMSGVFCAAIMQKDFNSLKCDSSYRNQTAFRRTCYGFCAFLIVCSVVLSCTGWIHFGDSGGATNADEISALELSDTLGDSVLDTIERMVFIPRVEECRTVEEAQLKYDEMQESMTIMSIVINIPFVLIKTALLLSILFALYGGVKMLFLKTRTSFINASMIIIFVIHGILYLIFAVYNIVDFGVADFVSGNTANVNLVFNEIVVIKPTLFMILSTASCIGAYILSKYYQKNYIC